MAVVSSFDMTGEQPATTRADLSLPVTKGGNYFLKVNHGGLEADGQGQFYLVYETLGSGNPSRPRRSRTASRDGRSAHREQPRQLLHRGQPRRGRRRLLQGRHQRRGHGLGRVRLAARRLGPPRLQGHRLQGRRHHRRRQGLRHRERLDGSLHRSRPIADTDLVIKLEATLPPDVTNTGSYYICGFHVGPAVQ